MCLAVFALARLSHLDFIFDPLSGAIVLGGAVAGIAFARGSRTGTSAAEHPSHGSVWFAAGAVAAAVAISLAELLPLGAIPVFVVVILAHVVPFWCVGRGLDLLLRDPAESSGSAGLWGAGVAGKIAGVVLAPVFLAAAGGAPRVSWLAALALAVLGLAFGGRGRLGVRTVAAGVVLAGAVVSWNGSGSPRHVSDPRGRLKPVIAELAPGGRAEPETTIWNADGRSDRLAFRGQESELLWIFTQGTAPVPVPVDAASRDLPWWQARFPLVAMAFAATRPELGLTIGSAAGSERAAASRFSSARVRTATYDAGAADPRRTVRASPESFDLVLLSSSHTTKSAWLHANVGDDRLYTRESFAEVWRSLQPEGVLAVVTSDERLFVRAVLTAAENASDRAAPLEARAWGFRVGPAARSSPYRFLLLAWREPPPPERAERMREAITAWPVETLFGPGHSAAPPYDSLTPDSLGRAFSRRAGRWLDLTPATDDRPVFFDIAREVHPYVRWTVAACLLPLLFVLLGPLSRERRSDLDAEGPPVALRLAELAGLGVAFSFGLAALALRVPFVTGVPFTRETLALAGVAAGFGFLWWRRTGVTPRAAWAVPVAAALLVAILAAGWEAWLTAAAGSASARQLVAAAAGLAVGAAVAATLELALGRLASDRPTVLAWAWVAFGVGAVGGVPLAAWLAHLHGWSFVWIMIVALYALSAGVATWGVRSAE